jgi:hypothetical protein
VPALPVAVRPVTTVHNHEDHVTNRIAEALQRHAQAAAPAPVATSAAPTPAPEAAPPQTPPAVTPATPAEPAAPEPLSLDDIDFDAPEEPAQPSPATPPAPTPEGGGETQSDQQAIATLQEMLDRGEIPEKIESQFLRTPRGRGMLETYKTFRELRKSPEEGGIGRTPTVDEIREGYHASQQLEAMRFEATQNPDSFVANLFTINPQTGQSFVGDPGSTQAVVDRIYGHIAEGLRVSRGTPMEGVYANLLASYSLPVFSNFLNHQYRKAMAMPQASDVEKSDKARTLDALQIVEMFVMGRPRPLNLNQPVNGTPQPGMIDPEKEEMRNRLQQYDQYYRTSQQQNYDNVQNNVIRGSEEAALKDIDQVFRQRGITNAYDAAMLAPHREALYNLVARSLPQADPRGWQTYELQLQRAAMGQADPADAAKTYRILFQNGLRNFPQVRETLEVLIRNAKSTSDQQHAQLAATQNRVAVNGQGAPAPQSVLPASQTARQPGQSKEDFWAGRIADKLGAAVSKMRT